MSNEIINDPQILEITVNNAQTVEIMSETATTPNIDLETLSDDQLEQILAKRRAEKNEQKQAQKVAYEQLKGDTVAKLCINAMFLNGKLDEFKVEAFKETQALYKMLQDYSGRKEDGKGNFTMEHDKYRITYRRQGKPTFDERSHQAEKHIIDFVNSKFDNDHDTRDLIMSLLERKKGELDIALVQKLYAMEDRFDDPNWKRGIELLKESYKYSHSKDYIRFETRNDKNEWIPINLQFSNI